MAGPQSSSVMSLGLCSVQPFPHVSFHSKPVRFSRSERQPVSCTVGIWCSLRLQHHDYDHSSRRLMPSYCLSMGSHCKNVQVHKGGISVCQPDSPWLSDHVFGRSYTLDKVLCRGSPHSWFLPLK